jgi:pimeloyl-ACP methyl ester carboxylesterase
LLLIHGLGGCWQWWLECLPELGRHRRTIAIDLPGFGRSEPLPAPADMTTHAETLVAFLDQLGVDHAIVVSHSMGGLVAMRLAASHPQRVAANVLVCAGGIHLDARRLGLLNACFKGLYALFVRPAVLRAFALRPRLRRLLFGGAAGEDGVVDAHLAMHLVPSFAAPGFLQALGAAVKVANDVQPEDVAAPTLVIWGKRDPILPVAAAHELTTRLPDGRIEVMDGVGHSPMIEHPRQFNALVSRFAAEMADRPRVGAARGPVSQSNT